ncbi:hypothetical protein RBI13_19730 [Alcaligenaceae bacterium A4P071]|nr:hypothetical protein [Alcaligenaceae bacterium B3P038]MDQ2151226.1 hypothetical protein [Alcaligenaceae bacterium C4P045]MDQ2187417.1 hypothetical protein [Alcaligenaceae bacterium A4P071]
MFLHLGIGFGVFACVFACALLGLHLRNRLPQHHLSDDSVSSIKLATGLIATIAALVLGLMISSAKGSFDNVRNDLVRNAVNVISLDRTLAQFGPTAQPLREALKHNYATWVALLATREEIDPSELDRANILTDFETFQLHLAALPATTAQEQRLLARALNVSNDVFSARWTALMHKDGSIPIPLLFVVVCWLAVIFGTFGLFAPRNGTVIVFFLLCSLSASGAIFVILEMDTPLDGIICISLTPMHDALARLGS